MREAAAVVAPIGRIKGDGFDFTIGTGNPGPVAIDLRTSLVDIQHGKSNDPYGWLTHLDI